MANYFNLTLDTTGPANPSVTIEANNTYATALLVNCSISTSDATTTGYQMKFWGDIDLTWAKANGIIGSSDTTVDEAHALWLTYTTTKQLQLTAGDGNKTIYCKIRDDVYNVSSQCSDSIILDSTLPVVTISGPDVTKVSKITGKDVCSFSFQCDSVFKQYAVKVVSSYGAAYNTGTQIGTTNGSTNMNGTGGNYAASTPINCTIDGADLEVASSGDGTKIIKVFVQDLAGNWSA